MILSRLDNGGDFWLFLFEMINYLLKARFSATSFLDPSVDKRMKYALSVINKNVRNAFMTKT